MLRLTNSGPFVRAGSGSKRHLSRRAWMAGFCLLASLGRGGAGDYTIVQDAQQGVVTMADGGSNLVLRLNFRDKCVLEQVVVRGRQVLAPASGVASGIQVSGQWFTTRSAIATPKVRVARNAVTVSDIVYGGGAARVREAWKFTVQREGITWQIDRDYFAGGTLEDACMPGWDFSDMNTWTGGLLGHGGVAWNKYLETPNATYGAHTGAVTLWSRDKGDCLRIEGQASYRAAERGTGAVPAGLAVKFSRQPSGVETVSFCASAGELQPKHNLRRFHPGRQDIWAPFRVAPGRLSVRYALRALSYAEACNRGTFRGLNGQSIRELLNTIGRYGVIDRGILGGNGWRSGFACLHEQWFAQMGIAIDDPAYLANCAATFDRERDHAIDAAGRVKSRWCHEAGDAMPGSYDALGYYEAQWGYLLDSQPAYVICVAELFDLTGERAWLGGQKAACERALDYLLRRERGGTGLVAMMTASHLEQRGSDWIDIIWAAHENALVNAELYYALTLWAEAEDALGDTARAGAYRQHAAKLKASFNRTTAEGGFWDPQNQWYVYWRDQDGSLHGNNLVAPVNFAAIGYGLCDDPARRGAILRRMESEMQKENLFFWPLNFYPYQPGEGHASNFPYPKYENGDIFLSWGELGVRAYARAEPAIALKYVKKVLAQYERDGLSFQRYERQSQRGAGDDILAGNCMTIVGLYRDLYGLQPRHNRLYLEPHLVAELNGTQLRYELRNQLYLVDLDTSGCRLAVEGFSVRDAEPFGLNVRGDTAEFFAGSRNVPALLLTRTRRAPIAVRIEAWPATATPPRRWVESCSRAVCVRHVLCDLQPGVAYTLRQDGRRVGSFRANAAGRIGFNRTLEPSKEQRFELAGP